ncbi:ImmA/IrrE family metallo-endopeptidase [Planctomycetales bacterium ZRK34]|nr:ImmA/IrrE family metallo-endopeptidase [Planctomycetales bacterium ZRK34]
MTDSSRSSESLIEELVRTTKANDPAAAIRLKARELIELHVDSFGTPTIPINVDVLASLRGIKRSKESPLHSPDAELRPDGTGGVEMRINADRPETRQRFSIAHEISHTFFPDYTTKPWCRTDARYRDRADADDYLEMLCDIGAAELLFPRPWFKVDANAVTDAAGLINLAKTYHASREATIRRYVETSPESVAAAYLIWKLKPTQKSTVGRRDQGNLYGLTPEDEIREASQLRIEYTASSESFNTAGHFIPKDKSVEKNGPLYQAASLATPTDGECFLNFGQLSGMFHVWAVPLWTPDDQRGVNGEYAVAAILRPLKLDKLKRRQAKGHDSTLFN